VNLEKKGNPKMGGKEIESKAKKKEKAKTVQRKSN